MKVTKRINLDLPADIIESLTSLATLDSRKLKPFLELHLTKLSKKTEKLKK